jgi:hypothetical protein
MATHPKVKESPGTKGSVNQSPEISSSPLMKNVGLRKSDNNFALDMNDFGLLQTHTKHLESVQSSAGQRRGANNSS